MGLVSVLAVLALVAQAAFAHPLTFYKNPGPGLPVLNVVCPGSAKECPDGNTCCALGNGNFGCCPKLHAVCCSDKKHCCAEGYTCSQGDGQCLKASFTHPLLELATPSDLPSSPEITCPDGKQSCPTGDTCCKVSDTSYGCCPKPNAVCCSDMKHCCPEGYMCDIATGKCQQGVLAHPLMKFAILPNKQEVGTVTCPDHSDVCPDGDTCCPIGGNKQGCCPHVDAMCCPDQKHCCAQGSSCGSDGKKCTRGTLIDQLVEIVRPLKEKDVICPDHRHECPSGETCCKQGSSYGCCPKPNAECCSDNNHCCPEGYTCSMDKCTQRGSYHPLMEVLASRLEKQEVGNFVCPDRTTMCPDQDTCCPIGGGKDGCCPKVHGVCCPDEEHCCPEGHVCSTSGDKKCIGGDSSHPMLKLYTLQDTPSVKVDPPPVIVCPNSVDECSLGSTCCMLDSGMYGCCPKEHAVCCSHGKQCCPKGYTCNDKEGLCESVDDTVPFT